MLFREEWKISDRGRIPTMLFWLLTREHFKKPELCKPNTHSLFIPSLIPEIKVINKNSLISQCVCAKVISRRSGLRTTRRVAASGAPGVLSLIHIFNGGLTNKGQIILWILDIIIIVKVSICYKKYTNYYKKAIKYCLKNTKATTKQLIYIPYTESFQVVYRLTHLCSDYSQLKVTV